MAGDRKHVGRKRKRIGGGNNYEPVTVAVSYLVMPPTTGIRGASVAATEMGNGGASLLAGAYVVAYYGHGHVSVVRAQTRRPLVERETTTRLDESRGSFFATQRGWLQEDA
eukprot:GHVU01171008.1.p4 GENE.GHVU01171008.1~~GHVU01171008.1.p4  ORF type:complete len:111 (-),score=13.19 GHVU01171008.1:1639-1971(-)